MTLLRHAAAEQCHKQTAKRVTGIDRFVCRERERGEKEREGETYVDRYTHMYVCTYMVAHLGAPLPPLPPGAADAAAAAGCVGGGGGAAAAAAGIEIKYQNRIIKAI